MEKKAAPSEEDITKTQEQVLQAVQGLFDQHKHLMPSWQDKQLEVV